MHTEIEISVDFMDMTNDRRLWVTSTDVGAGVIVAVGRHVVVGDDDADAKVARITSVDEDGNIELEVLPGSVESHAHLLTSA